MLSRPLAGLDEEASEFERQCAAARADIVDRAAASSSGDDGSDDDEDSGDEGSSSGGEEDGGGRIWHTSGVSPFSHAQEPGNSMDAGAHWKSY